MRILVSGGGSGGHITPVLAVLAELRRQVDSLDTLYIAERGNQQLEILREAGVAYQLIYAGKFRRFHHWKWWQYFTHIRFILLNIRDTFRLGLGFMQSLWQISRFKPDVILCKGGYVSLPVGWAARWKRIPYVIHDSDSLPGLTNRLLAKHAARIAVGFPSEHYSYPKQKMVYIGVPVRAELRTLTITEAREQLGLSSKMPTILITGGSLGARVINQAVLTILPQIINNYQIIHISGQLDYERVAQGAQELQLTEHSHYHLYEFLGEEMVTAITAADLVVSRSGATILAELGAAGKPSILIPNPKLPGGHQLANATIVDERGAAVVLSEEKIAQDPSILSEAIFMVMEGTKRRQELSHHIATLFPTDAASRLAKLLHDVVKGI